MRGGRDPFSFPLALPDSTKPPVKGYVLWLDASDASTFTLVSTKVSVWADKSEMGNDATQATDANRPTYTSRTINGVVCPEWSVDTFMSSPVGNSSREQSTVFVGVVDDLSTHRTLWGDNDTQSNEFRLNQVGNGLLNTLKADLAVLRSAVAQPSAGSPFAVAQIITPTTIYHRRDSVSSVGAESTTFNPGQTLRLGNNSALLADYDGLMAEIIRWPFALSDSEIDDVMQYLKHKWGTP